MGKITKSFQVWFLMRNCLGSFLGPVKFQRWYRIALYVNLTCVLWLYLISSKLCQVFVKATHQRPSVTVN